MAFSKSNSSLVPEDEADVHPLLSGLFVFITPSLEHRAKGKVLGLWPHSLSGLEGGEVVGVLEGGAVRTRKRSHQNAPVDGVSEPIPRQSLLLHVQQVVFHYFHLPIAIRCTTPVASPSPVREMFQRFRVARVAVGGASRLMTLGVSVFSLAIVAWTTGASTKAAG